MREGMVTVAVVPRERFGMAVRSLDNVLANTRCPYEMVYVDGGSPAGVAEEVEKRARAEEFTLVRTEHYLSPNEARNLAMQCVSTPYVVFVDNDVLVEPGWLETLVACAEETGAWVVGPLYCDGEGAARKIHMTGGKASVVEKDGERRLAHAHYDAGRPVAETRMLVERGPTELIEFHTVLVRSDVFERLGPLDEELLSAHEHVDLCLQVREAGGEVYLEPAAEITYVPPGCVEAEEREYFNLRWSVAWNEATVARFRSKWRLSEGAVSNLGWWLDKHRRLSMRSAWWARRLLGRRLGTLVERKVLAEWERRRNARRYPEWRYARRASWMTRNHRVVVAGRRVERMAA